MYLIRSWQESLTLLLPKNLKLFALVTLNSIIALYKLLLRYWWWVVLLAVFTKIINSTDIPLRGEPWSTYRFMHLFLIFLFCYISFLLLTFVICLSTRPSVAQKDFSYFKSYLPYFLSNILFIISFYIVWSFAVEPLFTIQPLPYLETFLVSPLFLPAAGASVYIFFLLFFLDSDKKPMQVLFSWLRAIKMTWYNFPICFVVTISYIFLKGLIDYYVWSIVLIDPTSFERFPFLNGSLLLDPIVICIFANIYIKRLHEQFDLYFKQPK